MTSPTRQSSPATSSKRPPQGYGRNRRLAPAIRLWFAVMVANVLGLAVAVGVSVKIRGLEHDPSSEPWWLALYYGTMLVVGFVDALWVDEVAFKGAFRRTHLQGRAARAQAKRNPSDQDVEEIATSLQRSDISFPLIAIAAAGLSYLLFNVVNRGFDDYHKRVGQYFAEIRSLEAGAEQAQRRRDAVEALSSNTRPEVIPFLIRQLERSDEIAAWSAWAIGRQHDMKHRRRVLGPLRNAVKSKRPDLRREALLALARLQHRPSAPDLLKEIEAELGAGETFDRRLLWGLAYLQVPTAIPTFERALYHPNAAVQRVAAWAAAQLRDQKDGRQVVDLLHERLPSASFETQCAIVHALGILADERSNFVLLEHFDSLPAKERTQICSAEQLPLRPDGKGTDQHLLMATQGGRPNETFALRTLEALGSMRATSPEVRAKVEPWLEALAKDLRLGLSTRQSAESLLSGIREGRDDSQSARKARAKANER